MKSFHASSIALLLIILLFALVAANLGQPVTPAQNAGAAALALQATATLPVGGESVIGSTNGIVIMGAVITIIVIVPLLFRKKRKEHL